MNLKKLNATIMVSYQRQGYDKNGNPLYIINLFDIISDDNIYNINFMTKHKTDKYGNIKVTSYNIDDTINRLYEATLNYN